MNNDEFHMPERREFDEPIAPQNPNLYVRMPIQGCLWCSNTYPWEEAKPWTFTSGAG